MSASNPTPGRQRLDSWKEIAAFFGRDERTVNRWEKERGLPVHRLPGSKGRVYAYADELSAWLAAPRNEEASSATLAGNRTRLVVIPAKGNQPGITSPGITAPPISEENSPSQGAGSSSRLKVGALGVAALVLLAAVGSLLIFHAAGGPRPEPSGLSRSAVLPITSSGVVLASTGAHDPEAEQLYLKGRYYWSKRTSDDLTKALDYFMQAIVHDPNYSQAYVGLADCYNLMREYSLMPSSEAYPRALAAAKKAVELDDQSSEAHASLAYSLFFGIWDLENGEREFRRAIDLNPNNPVSHHWHANALLALRRFPEALAEIERAQVLDPSSTSILADKGNILWHTGRHDEAIKLVTQVKKREPEFWSPHYYLKYMYRRQQDYPDFLSEQRKAASLQHDSSSLVVASAAERGYAAGGRSGMLAAILQAQQKLYARHSISPTELAESTALMGKKSDALEYLKSAYDLHETSLLFVEDYPEFDSLHDEPTYRDLIARLRLPVQN